MANVVTDILETRMILTGQGEYKAGILSAVPILRTLGVQNDQTAAAMLKLGPVAGIAAGAIATGIYKSVEAAGRMETMEQAFVTIEGSADAAHKRIAELQQFAATTPFDFEQSVRGAQRLRAMGIEGKDLIPTMTAVGNAVSAAGGNTETFNRVLLAIGQIQTKGRLSQEEVNQIAETGVPAMKILQRELGLSSQQIQNLGNNGIPAKKAIDALISGFNKDFGGAMDKQSKTLFGSLSNLTDAGNQLAGAFGAPLIKPITAVVQGTSNLINIVNQAPGPVKAVAAAVGVGAVVALGAFSGAMVLSQIQATRLAGANAQLLNDSLKAGQGAGGQATAEATLSGALQSAMGRSTTLIVETRLLAGAHWQAAEAAEAQAIAEGQIGRGLSPGNVPIPGRGAPVLPGTPTGPGAIPGRPPAGGISGPGTGLPVGAPPSAGVKGPVGAPGPAGASGIPGAPGVPTQPVGEVRGSFSATELASKGASVPVGSPTATTISAAEKTIAFDTAAMAAAGSGAAAGAARSAGARSGAAAAGSAAANAARGATLLERGIGTLKGLGGGLAIGIGTQIAGTLAHEALGPVSGEDRSTVGAVKRIADRAITGAQFGSFLGLPGLAGGAALGGAFGAIEDIMIGLSKPKPVAPAEAPKPGTPGATTPGTGVGGGGATDALLGDIKEILSGIKDNTDKSTKFPLDLGTMAASRQMEAIASLQGARMVRR